MKKRFLNLFLALAMVVLVLPMAADAAGCQHNWVDGVCQNATCREVCKHESKTWEITKQATCTSTGLTGGYVCDVCAKVISGHREIPMADHEWDEGTTTKIATCRQEGEKSFECIDCDATKTETIEKLPCVIEILDAVAPSCTEAGLTEGKQCTYCETAASKCAWCDISMQAQEEVDAIDHAWNKGTVTQQATCTVDGVKTFACSRCDETKTEVIKASHTWKNKAAADATCVTDGWKGGKVCGVCGEPQNASNVIPATGEHTWQFAKMVSAATCTAARVDEYECKDCDATMTKNNGNEVALDHDWNKGTVTQKATCTVDGVKTFACSRCDETKTEVIKASHTWKNKDAADATCVADGWKGGKACSVCGEPQNASNVIPATGEHTWQFAKMVSAATCTAARVDEYECKDCDATMTKENGNEVALDHDWNKGTVTQEKTCTVDGVKTFACSRCDETKTETIEAKHNFKTKDAAPATCVTDGWKGGKACTVCGEPQDAGNVISKTGEHTWQFAQMVSAATCTAARVDEYECKDCDATMTKNNGNEVATGHSYKFARMVSPATCTAARVDEYKCENCGDIMTKNNGNEIAMDHDFVAGKVTRKATCEVYGLQKYECSRCDAEEVRTIEKLKCVIEPIAAVPATCNNPGATEGTKCSHCGNGQYCTACAAKLITPTAVPALGHNMELVKTVKKATCDKDGKGIYNCTRCGYDGVEQVIAAIGHNYVEIERWEPTCEKDGIVETNCTNCNTTLRDRIDALGHNTDETLAAVAPTCIATGLTEGKKCTACNATVVEQEEVPMASHTWETVTGKAATCTTTGLTDGKKCSVCGAVHTAQQEIPLADHNYVGHLCTVCETYDHEHEGPRTGYVAPTCTAIGTETYHCDECGFIWTEEVPATGHSFADGKCSVCQADDPGHQHSYSQIGYNAPGCLTTGLLTEKCSVCQDVKETTINALGHGYSNGACSRCGAVDPAATSCNHSATTSSTTAATCTRNGATIETCNSCGEQINTTSIPATGIHTYDANNRCTGCGQKDPNKITYDNQLVYPLG